MPLPELPLKEYKVTLYSRPKTFTVWAQTAAQAEGIAKQNYEGAHPSSLSFYRSDVIDLDEVNSWPNEY